ncbi:hypothetical protein CLV51_1021150 [Chitinophaga niastensis]|uniref:Uncharacterized protein n=1 Tax=Chitinophaga niastensis TaxID=536980 RepID=A0A2P8HPX6_CHINA|nr:hypothetical protein CLV51_1021150 [Chitinophaga niastensis]
MGRNGSIKGGVTNRKLNFNPTTTDRNGSDHNLVAKDYTNIVADALTELFPNLDGSVALALSWGGLDSTSAFLNDCTQLERDNIININNTNSNDTAGTKCN